MNHVETSYTKNDIRALAYTYRMSRRDRVMRKNHGRCFYCGQKLQNRNPNKKHYMTIDHIIPRAKGGTGHISNLAPSCERCNVLKGAKDLGNFLKKVRVA